MDSFKIKLKKCWNKTQAYLCLGLDPALDKIPTSFRKHAHPFFAFNKEIIDHTADLVCAFKPQIAYYSGQSLEEDLLMTFEYLQKNYPHIPTILDAKRGDIGSTAEMYAKEAFEVYKADSVTLNPYMGMDTIEPFKVYKDKGLFILCRTSNLGSHEFQNLMTPTGKKLFEIVASATQQQSDEYWGMMGLVAGATHAQDISAIRTQAPELPLLVPGVGTQGGSLQEVVQNGRNSQGEGLLINISRAIIYAGGDGFEFGPKVRAAAMSWVEQMRAMK